MLPSTRLWKINQALCADYLKNPNYVIFYPLLADEAQKLDAASKGAVEGLVPEVSAYPSPSNFYLAFVALYRLVVYLIAFFIYLFIYSFIYIAVKLLHLQHMRRGTDQ